MAQYIPDRGDVVRLEINFNDSEPDKKEKKAALIITPKAYNEKTGLAVVCPVKVKVKGYPFEVVIPDNLEIGGVIISDQVKSINWKIRNAEFICKLPEGKFSEVLSRLLTLF